MRYLKRFNEEFIVDPKIDISEELKDIFYLVEDQGYEVVYDDNMFMRREVITNGVTHALREYDNIHIFLPEIKSFKSVSNKLLCEREYIYKPDEKKRFWNIIEEVIDRLSQLHELGKIEWCFGYKSSMKRSFYKEMSGDEMVETRGNIFGIRIPVKVEDDGILKEDITWQDDMQQNLNHMFQDMMDDGYHVLILSKGTKVEPDYSRSPAFEVYIDRLNNIKPSEVTVDNIIDVDDVIPYIEDIEHRLSAFGFEAKTYCITSAGIVGVNPMLRYMQRGSRFRFLDHQLADIQSGALSLWTLKVDIETKNI